MSSRIQFMFTLVACALFVRLNFDVCFLLDMRRPKCAVKKVVCLCHGPLSFKLCTQRKIEKNEIIMCPTTKHFCHFRFHYKWVVAQCQLNWSGILFLRFSSMRNRSLEPYCSFGCPNLQIWVQYDIWECNKLLPFHGHCLSYLVSSPAPGLLANLSISHKLHVRCALCTYVGVVFVDWWMVVSVSVKYIPTFSLNSFSSAYGKWFLLMTDSTHARIA